MIKYRSFGKQFKSLLCTFPRSINTRRYFSTIPEDPKYQKNEILRVRNEAKKLLEEEKREKEEREKFGLFSPEEMMTLLVNIETEEDFEIKVRGSEKPVLLFCYAQ